MAAIAETDEVEAEAAEIGSLTAIPSEYLSEDEKAEMEAAANETEEEESTDDAPEATDEEAAAPEAASSEESSEATAS